MNTPTPTQAEKPAVQIEKLIEAHSERPIEVKNEAPQPQPARRRSIWGILGIILGVFIAIAIIGGQWLKLIDANARINSQATALAQATATLRAQVTIIQAKSTTIQSQETWLAAARSDLKVQKNKSESAQATIQVQEQALLSIPPMFESELISGPHNGDLVHNPNDQLASIYCAGVYVKDFIATARFTNPTNYYAQPFDYAFAFRSNYRVLLSLGKYFDLSHGTEEFIDSRFYPNLNLNESGANTITIMVIGDTVTMMINDIPANTVIAKDLSLSSFGDVCVGTGFWKGDEVLGKSTKFSNFKVWSLPNQ